MTSARTPASGFSRLGASLALTLLLCACGGGGGGSSSSGGTATPPVQPTSFSPPTRQVGDTWVGTWTSGDAANGNASVYASTMAVTAVNADGSYNVKNTGVANGNPVDFTTIYTYNKLGQETAETGSSSTQSTTRHCTYSPADTSLQAPLSVGKVWTFDSTSICDGGAPSHATGSASVLSRQTIHTSLGDLDTLRIVTFFPAADGASIAKSDCYWSTQYGLNVKCTVITTSAASGASNSVTTTTANFELTAYKGSTTGVQPFSGTQTPTIAQSFAAPARRVGENWTVSAFDASDLTTPAFIDTETVTTASNSDGVYTKKSTGISYGRPLPFSTLSTLRKNGQALSEIYSGSYTASCTDDTDPLNVLPDYYLGMTWDITRTNTCTPGSSTSSTSRGMVVSRQTIATALGNLDTLLIAEQYLYNANNYIESSSCYWSIALGMNVKCSYYQTSLAPSGSNSYSVKVDRKTFEITQYQAGN